MLEILDKLILIEGFIILVICLQAMYNLHRFIKIYCEEKQEEEDANE